MIDLDQAKAICDAASKGPWLSVDLSSIRLADESWFTGSAEDRKFSAFARTALPEALEEIEELREAAETNDIAIPAYIDNIGELTRKLELAEAVCHAAGSLKSEIEDPENKDKDLCCFNVWFIMCDAVEDWRASREAWK